MAISQKTGLVWREKKAVQNAQSCYGHLGKWQKAWPGCAPQWTDPEVGCWLYVRQLCDRGQVTDPPEPQSPHLWYRTNVSYGCKDKVRGICKTYCLAHTGAEIFDLCICPIASLLFQIWVDLMKVLQTSHKPTWTSRRRFVSGRGDFSFRACRSSRTTLRDKYSLSRS